MKSRAVKKQKTKKPEAQNGTHGINIVWGEWLFEGPDKINGH
ncbi:hypothetical protein V6917_13540 [Pectobacterium brasiliense]